MLCLRWKHGINLRVTIALAAIMLAVSAIDLAATTKTESYSNHFIEPPPRLGNSGIPLAALQSGTKNNNISMVSQSPSKPLGKLPFQNPDRKLARSVAYLSISNQKQCTGFLVGERFLVTAYHCILDDAGNVHQPYAFKVFMDYWNQNDMGKISSLVKSIPYQQPELDFVLLELSEPLGAKYGWLELSTEAPKATKGAIKLIQYRRGNSRELSASKQGLVRVGKKTVHYRANTESGSCGAPVFNSEGNMVIAMHHIGAQSYNEGVMAHLILKEIRPWIQQSP